jgi:hypothetical protein
MLLRLRLGLATGALLVPLLGSSASGAAACPTEEPVQFAPALVRLQSLVGEPMGAPRSCSFQDADGDTLQQTTTGLALYRPSTDLALFSNGQQFWTLTGGELQQWTGNWHEGFGPPPPAGAPAPTRVALPPAPPQPLAWIQAADLLEVRDGQPQRVRIAYRGTAYVLETDLGCPDAAQAVGQAVYVRSAGLLGSPGSALILLDPHQECGVLAIRPDP